jgi:hypothetical protein
LALTLPRFIKTVATRSSAKTPCAKAICTTSDRVSIIVFIPKNSLKGLTNAWASLMIIKASPLRSYI